MITAEFQSVGSRFPYTCSCQVGCPEVLHRIVDLDDDLFETYCPHGRPLSNRHITTREIFGHDWELYNATVKAGCHCPWTPMSGGKLLPDCPVHGNVAKELR